MVKICPKCASLAEYRWEYCPICGSKLWNISVEEFEQAPVYYQKPIYYHKVIETDKEAEEAYKRWLEWLKKRHPEFENR